MPTLSKEKNNFGRTMNILTLDTGERIRVGKGKELKSIINEATRELGTTPEETEKIYRKEGNLNW